MVKQTTTNGNDPNTIKQTETTAPSNVEYSQILPMTFEERVEMYMKCSKLELAKMLAERDRLGMDAPTFIPSMPHYSPWWLNPVTCENADISIS